MRLSVRLSVCLRVRLLAGARYSIEPNGLKIRNVTRQDNGEYTCRAEVKDEGRYNERTITVTVHSQYTFITRHSLVRAKGEVLVLLYVFLFVRFFCQRFLDNPRADSRQILNASVGRAMHSIARQKSKRQYYPPTHRLNASALFE